jgi:hypothetical protein
MNIIDFNPDWTSEIAFCFVDNTRIYQSGIRELMKNQADGTLGREREDAPCSAELRRSCASPGRRCQS